MIEVKDLLLAAEKLIETSKEAGVPLTPEEEELERCAASVREIMIASKSFEYTGKISMKYNNAIKCVDASVDLDDVVRVLNQKKTDIEFDGHIILIKYPDKPEPPKEEAKTESKPESEQTDGHTIAA